MHKKITEAFNQACEVFAKNLSDSLSKVIDPESGTSSYKILKPDEFVQDEPGIAVFFGGEVLIGDRPDYPEPFQVSIELTWLTWQEKMLDEIHLKYFKYEKESKHNPEKAKILSHVDKNIEALDMIRDERSFLVLAQETQELLKSLKK
ncbi:hypothetical protein [Desulfatibacillum aliphaticivorans]|uniref:hypothetical protein n=1 Tax=Desulfatibacillum aliphaticivorans TaxID=218208 RepID=UPI0003F8ADFF|nr:hypothetical protein [Desulfatibacillum aliphaticivorans]